MYKPLPKTLTVKDSNIHGLGLFATEEIAINTDLGISHVLNQDYQNNYIRTPLGGFINHSDSPNVELIDMGHTMRVLTIKTIETGEELKLKYHLYTL